jgi:nucleotide-binding universal stress UspA family protein
VEGESKMYKRILVPLDGSARAERAVSVAARLARAAGGTVILMEVSNPPVGYGPYVDISGQAPLPAIVWDNQKASAYLNTVAKDSYLAGVTTETTIFSGPVADAILGAVESSHADLIVMSSHGRTGLSRWVLGSVAQKVVHHAPVPVLVLREAGAVPLRPVAGTGRQLRALITLDGSPLAEAALLPAALLVGALAAPAQGALHLMRVIETAYTGGAWGNGERSEHVEADAPAAKEAALKEASEYLIGAVERLRHGGFGGLKVGITWSVTFGVDAADTIIRAAQEGEGTGAERPGASDVLAMATHGRGGLGRWVMGSVTERVLTGTTLPMLIVRPREAAALQEAAETQAIGTSPLPRTSPLP